MAYTATEARQHLLDTLAGGIDLIGVAVASLGEAYEQLDDYAAERLEEQLFRPVQLAYGRAQRTYSGFADRYDLPARTFDPQIRGHPSTGAKGFIEGAVGAVGEADTAIATLQDSMLPIEVGDAELRAGLMQVRELIGEIPVRARELVRTLGR
jgi:hypothetical protein